MKEVREIHREADLTADPRARDILTSQQAETEAQPIAKRILPARHSLNLRSSQVSVVGVTAINLGS